LELELEILRTGPGIGLPVLFMCGIEIGIGTKNRIFDLKNFLEKINRLEV